MKKHNIFILFLLVLGSFVYAQNNTANSDSASGTNIVDTPITTNIIQEVGVGGIPHFQYYVSKAFNLNLVSEKRESMVESGQLIRKNQTARELITVSEKLPGLLRRFQVRGINGYQLALAFENYDGNPVIFFGVHRAGDNEKYYILYHDNTRRIVKYGNDEYVVSYDGEEPPYILIKMRESSKETDSARKASGLFLGE